MEPFLTSLPAVEVSRLRLRPLILHDADEFRTLTDDPRIVSAIAFLTWPFTRGDAEALIRGAGDGRDCFWGVWRTLSPGLAGTVGTHLRGTAEIEIGYWFSPAVAGQGVATEGVGAIVAALTEAYPWREIFSECRPENTASWRLLHRVGFRPTGAEGFRSGRMRLTLER